MMFQGLTAWFSSSVPEEVKAIWSRNYGLQYDLCTADYIFSDDPLARDTIGFYKTKDYQDLKLTIFKSEWILDAADSKSLCEHPIADYILVEPNIYIELEGFGKSNGCGAGKTRKHEGLGASTTSRVCSTNDNWACVDELPIEIKKETDFGNVNASQSRTSNHQRLENQQADEQSRPSKRKSSSMHSPNSEAVLINPSGDVKLPTATAGSKVNNNQHKVAASVKNLDHVRSEPLINSTINVFHSSMCDGFVDTDELEFAGIPLMDFVPGKNGCEVRRKAST